MINYTWKTRVNLDIFQNTDKIKNNTKNNEKR